MTRANQHWLDMGSCVSVIGKPSEVTGCADGEPKRDVVYLGFAEAFDKVDHGVFIEEQKPIGVVEYLLK